MKIWKLTSATIALGLTSGLTNAASITTFTDRALFDAAVGPTVLENFTSTSHFPIPGGTLDSTTSFGSLNAGDIQVGATYSTPVGPGNYFNIDAGGGFTGGFLDSLSSTGERDLTITYDSSISAFGFDTNSLMPNFDITINFTSGGTYTNSFSGISGMTFFGFQSDLADISSVVIDGNGSSFNFAIDNHSFGGVSAVPVPAAVWLFGSGLIGLIGFARRKKA